MRREREREQEQEREREREKHKQEEEEEEKEQRKQKEQERSQQDQNQEIMVDQEEKKEFDVKKVDEDYNVGDSISVFLDHDPGHNQKEESRRSVLKIPTLVRTVFLS